MNIQPMTIIKYGFAISASIFAVSIPILLALIFIKVALSI